MEIREVTENKKQYLSLLLLADEQEDMIDRYLDRGTMYVLDDSGVKAECVVTDEGSGVLEVKNLAVAPESQRKGYGRALLEYIADRYRESFFVLQAGTGDSPLTVPFYERCGFVRHHTVKNFLRSTMTIHTGGRSAADGYDLSAKRSAGSGRNDREALREEFKRRLNEKTAVQGADAVIRERKGVHLSCEKVRRGRMSK